MLVRPLCLTQINTQTAFHKPQIALQTTFKVQPHTIATPNHFHYRNHFTRSSSKTPTHTMPTKTTTPDPTPSTTSPDSNPVYFWRPHEEGTGYLGQWYPSPFSISGDTYATCEMWMMVQKARLFGDEAVAREMLQTSDPKAHKALGRKVRGFDGGVWDESMYPPLFFFLLGSLY